MATAQRTRLTILGSTGSIGRSTLDVVARHPDRFDVVALAANTSVDDMAVQCLAHRPRYAVMSAAGAADRLQERLAGAAPDIEVLAGEEALVRVASLDEVDSVMAAIVGAAGLLPALAAARAAKRVLLANKEALVMSGALFMDAVRHHGATLLPIDSEHNAIFQCLPDDYVAGQVPDGVRRIVLTASGGPFRNTPLAELDHVTPKQACAHPNWEMGRKISVDSATMMNKGLEVIEAGWLFGLDRDRIEVVLHPQSLVHSLVEYTDGSILAQLGSPDMRVPISYALDWPERIESGAQSLDIIAAGRLDFEAPDPAHFPCLALAYDALAAGGTAPAVLNAANEVAVAAFLGGDIPFTSIHHVIRQVLADCSIQPAQTLEAVLDADNRARRHAAELIRDDPVVVAR